MVASATHLVVDDLDRVVVDLELINLVCDSASFCECRDLLSDLVE